MEFLLVAPVYFALLGGLFTVGELLLLNNRMNVADRNMSYIIPYFEGLEGKTMGQMLKVMINLTGRNAADKDDGDLGYTHQSPVFSFKKVDNTNNKDGFVAETNWGTMYTTALTVQGVELPSFITGMLAMISLLSGDEVHNDDFVYTLGELLDGQLGRHYVIMRKSSKDVEYRDSNYCKAEENMERSTKALEIALKLSAENILGNPPANSGSINTDVTQENYKRVFGDLFSSATQGL